MTAEKQLPKSWVCAQLQDITRPGGSRNPKTIDEEKFFYVDIEALDDSSQRITAPKHIKVVDAPSRARMSIQEGDVIFSLVRPYLKNIAIIPAELDGQIASTAYCVLRPTPAIDSKYLFYALTRQSFIDSIVTYGNTPPAARDNEFLRLSIPVAPLAEQRRIVAAIEEQFTRLDAGVAALKSARARLKQYRAAVLKAAVEGELTKEWREAHPNTEPASELLARILAEQQPPKGGKSVEPTSRDNSQLPALPHRWLWVTLGQIGEIGTGATPLRSRKDYYDGGSIPWITSGALNEETITHAEELITRLALRETNAKLFPKGTILVAMYGEGKTRGKAAVLEIEAATNQACAAIVMGDPATSMRQYTMLFF